MLCEKCGNKPAVVRLTKIINNKKSVMNLCADCAEDVQSNVSIPVFDGFSTLLSGLAGFDGMWGQSSKSSKTVKSCPVCKSTIRTINENGKLGCSECYSTFIEEIRPLLRQIHGNCVHSGAFPAMQVSQSRSQETSMNPDVDKSVENTKPDEEETVNNDKSEVQIYRDMMKDAIAKEDFEKAAELRDKIKKLESEGGDNE